jgi:T5SS/PEP-CTERM-associated repeat protein
MKLPRMALSYFALLSSLHAESFTTNIVDGIATNGGPVLAVGATGPFNFLLVTNGGRLTNGVSLIGDAAGADNNAAEVNGAGSIWQSTNNFILGNTGMLNRVSVLNGGLMRMQGLTTIGSEPSSSSNVLLVAGSGLVQSSLAVRIGHLGPGNALFIRAGGRMQSTLSILGREIGSDGNRVVVENAGSSWQLQNLHVGRAGSGNYVHVLDGAQLLPGLATVGQVSNAVGNHVLVSGAGSLWGGMQELLIGSNGPNSRVEVRDGARLAANSIVVGADCAMNELIVDNSSLLQDIYGALTLGNSANAHFNVVMFDGPEARGTNRGVMVGNIGSSNRFVIRNGAQFGVGAPIAFPFFSVGGSTVSRGNSVEILGAGSKLTVFAAMHIGDGGPANRLLVNGGELQTSQAQIGVNCLSHNNSALLTGPNTRWTGVGTIDVGFCSTNNTLVISNGAQVFAGLVRSSVQGGRQNVIHVTGEGTMLRAVADLVIGNSGGSNVLMITDNARVEGRQDRLGLTGSENIALISGAGTTWSNFVLTVGSSGSRNMLLARDSALLESSAVVVGETTNASQNVVEVMGQDTQWQISTKLDVGGAGHSNRFLVRGGQLMAQDVRVGADPQFSPGVPGRSHYNLLAVTGSLSAVYISSNLIAGYHGNSNRLEILEGAHVESHHGVIGDWAGTHNSALVSGPGSLWNVSSDLIVGRSATVSSLVISNGAEVTSATGYLGSIGSLFGQGSACQYSVSGSRVLVSGVGSAWNVIGPLFVGYGGVGNTLTISNAGLVFAQTMVIGRTDGGADTPFCPPAVDLNRVIITGGDLVLYPYDPNILEVRYGTLRVERGGVGCPQLLMTNRSSRLQLVGGSLACSQAIVDNQLPLVIGDGLHNAWLHATRVSAPRGIVVQPHAILSSRQAIYANVTNYGTLSVEEVGIMSSLTIYSNLVQQATGNILIGVGTHTIGVSNTAQLSGNLYLRQAGGSLSNSTFVIITARTLTGTFGNATNGARLKTVDNLGSLLVEYSSTSVTLRDYHTTDTDGDGVEDAWASAHFGHSPLTEAEKAADADNDGASTYSEFVAGTDPDNPTSVLRASIAYANGAATVSFPYAPGKNYQLEFSSDLINWSDLEDFSRAYPQPGICQWTDDGRFTGQLGTPARFFRVGVSHPY